MAIERRTSREKLSKESTKYTFLDELPEMTDYRVALQNQIFNIFLSSRDSVASTISFIFFHLARHPDVWNKLRQEVIDTGDAPLTFDFLNSLKYLKYVINESLRLLAPAGLTIRTCLQDCVLPSGGGLNGTEPIFVRKDTEVQIVFHALKKDPDIWGDDALKFRPERWEKMRTTWEYIPLLGGSGRTCPALQMALIEVSYVLVRFLREFKHMNNRDEEKDFMKNVKLTLESNKNGVKVGFVIA